MVMMVTHKWIVRLDGWMANLDMIIVRGMMKWSKGIDIHEWLKAAKRRGWMRLRWTRGSTKRLGGGVVVRESFKCKAIARMC